MVSTITLTLPTAYQQSNMITQVPALMQLLQTIQYPHIQQLQSELSQGFQLLGRRP